MASFSFDEATPVPEQHWPKTLQHCLGIYLRALIEDNEPF